MGSSTAERVEWLFWAGSFFVIQNASESVGAVTDITPVNCFLSWRLDFKWTNNGYVVGYLKL